MMTRLITGAALALAAATAVSTAASSNELFKGTNCMSPEPLRAYLSEAFSEGSIATGQLDNGNRVELFVSSGGSWTLVEYRDDGHGCVHAYGHGMQVDRGAVGLRLNSPS